MIWAGGSQRCSQVVIFFVLFNKQLSSSGHFILHTKCIFDVEMKCFFKVTNIRLYLLIMFIKSFPVLSVCKIRKLESYLIQNVNMNNFNNLLLEFSTKNLYKCTQLQHACFCFIFKSSKKYFFRCTTKECFNDRN